LVDIEFITFSIKENITSLIMNNEDDEIQLSFIYSQLRSLILSMYLKNQVVHK